MKKTKSHELQMKKWKSKPFLQQREINFTETKNNLFQQRNCLWKIEEDGDGKKSVSVCWTQRKSWWEVLKGTWEQGILLGSLNLDVIWDLNESLTWRVLIGWSSNYTSALRSCGRPPRESERKDSWWRENSHFTPVKSCSRFWFTFLFYLNLNVIIIIIMFLTN